jgi:hypothetical protein
MPESILNWYPLHRIRRNHALEHATLHMLTRKKPHPPMGGYSDMAGFWIIGNVDTEDLEKAAEEALGRLGKGEKRLAISPNCGTNFATAGLLAGIAAWLGMLNPGKGLRRKMERLPMVVSLVTLALIVSQPLGPLLQARVTTSASPGSLKISAIQPRQRKGIMVHRILTRD